MPTFGFPKPLIWLLVLTIGHAPVPWAHNHEWVGDAQPVAHLNYFHAGANKDLRLGWHVHVCCLDLYCHIPQDGLGVEDSSNGVVFQDEQSQVSEQETIAVHRRACKILNWNIQCMHTWPFRVVATRERSIIQTPLLWSNSHLYYLYCSLLI